VTVSINFIKAPACIAFPFSSFFLPFMSFNSKGKVVSVFN
jgi:hypothetical protein